MYTGSFLLHNQNVSLMPSISVRFPHFTCCNPPASKMLARYDFISISERETILILEKIQRDKRKCISLSLSGPHPSFHQSKHTSISRAHKRYISGFWVRTTRQRKLFFSGPKIENCRQTLPLPLFITIWQSKNALKGRKGKNKRRKRKTSALGLCTQRGNLPAGKKSISITIIPIILRCSSMHEMISQRRRLLFVSCYICSHSLVVIIIYCNKCKHLSNQQQINIIIIFRDTPTFLREAL